MMKGRYRDQIIGEDGTILHDSGLCSNQIVSSAGVLVASLLKGVGGPIGWLAVGSGDASAPAGWKAPRTTRCLLNEVYRQRISMDDIVFVDEAGQPSEEPTAHLRLRVTLRPGGVLTLREFGLYGGAATAKRDTGTLLNHVHHAPTTLLSRHALTRTILLSLEEASEVAAPAEEAESEASRPRVSWYIRRETLAERSAGADALMEEEVAPAARREIAAARAEIVGMAAPEAVAAAPTVVEVATEDSEAAPEVVVAATRKAVAAAPRVVMAPAPEVVVAAAPTVVEVATEDSEAAPEAVAAAPTVVEVATEDSEAAPEVVVAATRKAVAAAPRVVMAPAPEVVVAAAPTVVEVATEDSEAAPEVVVAAVPTVVVAAPEVVVTPASEVVVAPAPEVVAAAPAVVTPAPEVVTPAPEVVVTPASEVVVAPPPAVVVTPAPEVVAAAPAVVVTAPEVVAAAPTVVAATATVVTPAPAVVVAPAPEVVAAASTVVVTAPEVVAAPVPAATAPTGSVTIAEPVAVTVATPATVTGATTGVLATTALMTMMLAEPLTRLEDIGTTTAAALQATYGVSTIAGLAALNVDLDAATAVHRSKARLLLRIAKKFQAPDALHDWTVRQVAEAGPNALAEASGIAVDQAVRIHEQATLFLMWKADTASPLKLGQMVSRSWKLAATLWPVPDSAASLSSLSLLELKGIPTTVRYVASRLGALTVGALTTSDGLWTTEGQSLSTSYLKNLYSVPFWRAKARMLMGTAASEMIAASMVGRTVPSLVCAAQSTLAAELGLSLLAVDTLQERLGLFLMLNSFASGTLTVDKAVTSVVTG